MSQPVFRELLSSVDQGVLEDVGAPPIEDWLRMMAAVSVRNDFQVASDGSPRLAGREAIWNQLVARARTAVKELKTCARVSPESAKVLEVDLGVIFSPLRLTMTSQQTEMLLVNNYAPAEARKILEEIGSAEQFDGVPDFRTFYKASLDIPEEVPDEAPPISPAARSRVSFAPAPLPSAAELEQRVIEAEEVPEEAAAVPGPFGRPGIVRGFGEKAFAELAALITCNRGIRSVAAINAAARIAALLPGETEVDLNDACRELWNFRLQTYRASARGGDLAAADVVTFLLTMKRLVDPEVFCSILNKHHVAFGLEEFLNNTEIRPEDLAGLYMRLEGHGTLFHKGGDEYWFDGSTRHKIREGGRLVVREWEGFQEQVRTVIREELQTQLVPATQEALRAGIRDHNCLGCSSDVDRLRKATASLSDRGTAAICRACQKWSIEVPNEEVVGPPRRFPEISKETENVLLEMCEDFDKASAEPVESIFEAYLATCLRLGHGYLKHRRADTLTKELYKCRAFTKAARHGQNRCIGGLHLKTH